MEEGIGISEAKGKAEDRIEIAKNLLTQNVDIQTISLTPTFLRACF